MDITQRIILQADASQATREVQKFAQEGEKAKKAFSGGAGVGGGGGEDPFKAASSGRTILEQRHREHQQYLRDYQQASKAHDERFGRREPGGAAREGGGGFLSSFRRVVSGGSEALSGSPLTGGASALEGMGGSLAGAAPVIGAIVAVAMGLNKIADSDQKRIDKYFSSGYAQKFGAGNIEKFIQEQRQMMTTGNMTLQNADPYLQALAAAGGSYNAGTTNEALRLNLGYGVDAGVLGTAVAHRGQMGMSQNLNDVAGVAQSAFGRGGMTMFMSALENTMTAAMERGFRKGSAEFTNLQGINANTLQALTQKGGVTPQGAVGILNTVNAGNAAIAGGVKTPTDVYKFRLFHRPGDSYWDTVRRASAPGAENTILKDLMAKTKGNTADLETMVMQVMGFNDIRDADAWIKKGLVSSTILKSGPPAVDRLALDKAQASAAQSFAGSQITDITNTGKAEIIKFLSKYGPSTKAPQNLRSAQDLTKSALQNPLALEMQLPEKYRSQLTNMMPSTPFNMSDLSNLSASLKENPIEQTPENLEKLITILSDALKDMKKSDPQYEQLNLTLASLVAVLRGTVTDTGSTP